jgi:hypothetical protein
MRPFLKIVLDVPAAVLGGVAGKAGKSQIHQLIGSAGDGRDYMI